MRRRLLGSGPWPVHGLGDVFLLRGGRAQLAGGVAGTWRVLPLGPASGGGAALSVSAATGVPLEAVLELALEGRAVMELFVACWRLLRLLGAPPEQRLEPSGDFAWRRPASRCFPTCSDRTHPLTAEDLRTSALAQAAMHNACMVYAWCMHVHVHVYGMRTACAMHVHGMCHAYAGGDARRVDVVGYPGHALRAARRQRCTRHTLGPRHVGRCPLTHRCALRRVRPAGPHAALL